MNLVFGVIKIRRILSEVEICKTKKQLDDKRVRASKTLQENTLLYRKKALKKCPEQQKYLQLTFFVVFETL